MRVIQNAALFGLISGTGLLFYGMVEGSMSLALFGAGIGIIIGVPAAFLHFALQGTSTFKRNSILAKFQASIRQRVQPTEAETSTSQPTAKPVTTIIQSDPPASDIPVKVTSKRPEPEIIRPKVVPPPPAQPVAKIAPEPPADDEAIAIPVRVIPPETPETQAEAILAEVLPDPEPEPKPTGLSDAERRAIIDDIEAATAADLDTLLELAVHKDTLVRLYAIQKLGDLGDPSVQSVLDTTFTDDAEIIVRRAARLSLNKLGLDIPEIPTPAEESVSELSTHD